MFRMSIIKLFFSKFPRRKQHQSRNLWFVFGDNRKLTDTCFGCWTGNHVYSCHLFKVSYHEHGIYPGTIMYIALYNNWFDSILKHDTRSDHVSWCNMPWWHIGFLPLFLCKGKQDLQTPGAVYLPKHGDSTNQC